MQGHGKTKVGRQIWRQRKRDRRKDGERKKEKEKEREKQRQTESKREIEWERVWILARLRPYGSILNREKWQPLLMSQLYHLETKKQNVYRQTDIHTETETEREEGVDRERGEWIRKRERERTQARLWPYGTISQNDKWHPLLSEIAIIILRKRFGQTDRKTDRKTET